MIPSATEAYNVCIGNEAGFGVLAVSNYLNAVLIGSLAGRGLTTGGNNVCIGHASGFVLTSGSGNAFIGYNAGLSVTTGGNNVCIGNLANAGAALTNVTALGYNVLAASSNSCILGNGQKVMETAAGHIFHTTATTVSTATTLTAAAMVGGIVVSAPASALTITLDTAANVASTCFSGMTFGSLGYQAGSTIKFEWINTSAYAITVGVPASITRGGASTIAANTSRTCYLRCTAAATFVIYV